MDSLEKEEMQLDFTQEELIELIQAKNKEIKKLREELEKSKKNINTKEVDDEVNELLERIKAKQYDHGRKNFSTQKPRISEMVGFLQIQGARITRPGKWNEAALY